MDFIFLSPLYMSFVECVAPLLRGLKPGEPIHVGGQGHPRRMRCPAIEGIETCGGYGFGRRHRPPDVECVAPLLRGLKPA